MPIQRVNLREQVREELVAWLSDGRLKPGQRLEEERLSQAMGVSRTPLREALSTLASEGLVTAVPRRGFRVPKLSADTARDLLPMVGALEGLALRLSGPQSRTLAAGLDEINARLALPHLTPRQRADTDRRWHALLVSRNPNVELSAVLARLLSRLQPYAGSWDRGAHELETAQAEHAEIARHLGAGELEAAAEAVLRHRVREIAVVGSWMKRADPA